MTIHEQGLLVRKALAGLDAFALLDVMRDVVIVSDHQGSILYANDAVTELLGWPAAELTGTPLVTVVPERLRDAHREGFSRYTETGQPRILGGDPVAVPALHRDGHEVEVELSLSEHHLGEATTVIGVLRDLSPRRRLEHAESLSRYLALTGEVITRIAVVDDISSVEDAGRIILETVGVTLGWDAAVLWTVDDAQVSSPHTAWSRPVLADAMPELADRSITFEMGRGLPGRVVARGLPAWIEDVAADEDFPRHVIARRHALTSAFAFPIAAGERILAVVELLDRRRMDIDTVLLGIVSQIGGSVGRLIERRRSAEELARNRARKSAMLDSAFDAVVSMDHRGLVREWNHAAEATFGWTAAEALDRPLANLIIPPDMRQAHEHGLAEHLRTGRATLLGRPVELTASRRDGRTFPAEVAITRLEGVDPPEFTGFIRDISGRKQAQLALTESRDRLRGVVEILQESLLPDELPSVPGLDVAAAYRPAGDGTLIGGDFYDVLQVRDDRWVAFIGDVCGKGAEAARLTALIRYTLRSRAMDEDLLPALLRCNEAVLDHRPNLFCTAVYVEIEVGWPRTRLRVVRAGHPYPLVLRASGAVEPVEAPGALLGVLSDPALTVQEVWLEQGDTLVLYTDGLTEARVEGALLGEERLLRLLTARAGQDAHAIASGLCDQIVEMQDHRTRDDLAIVVIRQPASNQA